MERARRSKFYSTSETTTKEFKKNDNSVKILKMIYEPNIESSLSTTRVRQRLCDLMGTDVIRLNDKRYFQRLSQRLQEEYEGVMDKQEESRAAQENERLRRLMLEGIIEAPDDYRAVVHGEDKHKTKKTKKRKSKRRIRITESQEGYGTEHGQSMTSRSEEDDGATSKENVRTQVEILDDSQGARDTPDRRSPHGIRSTPTSILKKKDSKVNDRSAQRSREILVRPPHHESAGRSSSSCSTHSRKARRIKSAAPRLRRDKENQSDESSEDLDDRKYDTMSLPDYHGRHSKYSKHEPESIQRLRMEQTVAGLYSIAEELVSPVRTDDTPDRKGKKPY